MEIKYRVYLDNEKVEQYLILVKEIEKMNISQQ